MQTSISSSLTFIRLGCLAALIALTGCVTTYQPVDEVTSPPPPRTGSAPIVAQDAYARPIFVRPVPRENELVALLQSSAELTRAAKLKEPAVKTSLN